MVPPAGAGAGAGRWLRIGVAVCAKLGLLSPVAVSGIAETSGHHAAFSPAPSTGQHPLGIASGTLLDEETWRKSYDWGARLVFKTTTRGTRVCSGSFVGKSWVLTSAHCAVGVLQCKVYLASTGADRPQMVKKSFIHPEYDPEFDAHMNTPFDLMMLELTKEYP